MDLQVEQRALNCHLVTAEIVYHLPDYPSLLQVLIWQNLDTVPELPVLTKYIHYWRANVDGRLHSILVATASIVRPTEFRFASAAFGLQ